MDDAGNTKDDLKLPLEDELATAARQGDGVAQGVAWRRIAVAPLY